MCVCVCVSRGWGGGITVHTTMKESTYWKGKHLHVIEGKAPNCSEHIQHSRV